MFNHIFGSRDVCDARNSGRIVNEMALSFSYVLSRGKFIHRYRSAEVRRVADTCIGACHATQHPRAYPDLSPS